MVLFGTALFSGDTMAWAPTLQMGWETNNNVTKSIRQEKADSALTAGLDLSTLQILNRDWQLSYGGSLDTSVWKEYSGLNLTELGVHATLRRKLVSAPTPPGWKCTRRPCINFQKWTNGRAIGDGAA